MKLFDERLPFFKGNTHAHSTRSDGERSPGEAQELTLSFDLRSLSSYDGQRACWILEKTLSEYLYDD